MMAGFGKDSGIGSSVNQVSQEQPAEKHHLLAQKDPHAKRSRFPLLLDGIEVMSKGWDELPSSCQTTFISLIEYSYGPSFTTGISLKFSGGGGEGVRHSSPVAPQGFGEAKAPYFSDQIK